MTPRRRPEHTIPRCNVPGLSSETGPLNGAEGIRTPDPHNAIVVLYQLSYDPAEEQILDLRAQIATY